jgi:hypothetical protein
MKTILTLVSAIFFAMSQLRAEEPPINPSLGEIKQSGGYACVYKNTQTIRVYQNGILKVESACGTGRGFDDASRPSEARTTHNGRHTVLAKDADHYSDIYKAPMPYAIRFTSDGDWLHGSRSFVTMDGKGMAQSHGCVRLPIDVAKKIYDILQVGDTVDVVGSEEESLEHLGISKLFEKGGLRMKVAGPSPSEEDRKLALDMWLSGKLFANPYGEEDKTKIRVGYPCTPPSTWMPFLQFEKVVAPPGKHFFLKHSKFGKPKSGE